MFFLNNIKFVLCLQDLVLSIFSFFLITRRVFYMRLLSVSPVNINVEDTLNTLKSANCAQTRLM